MNLKEEPIEISPTLVGAVTNDSESSSHQKARSVNGNNDDNIIDTSNKQQGYIYTDDNTNTLDTNTSQKAAATISGGPPTDTSATGSNGITMNTTTPPSCPCYDIMTSSDPRLCGLCGRVVPVLDNLLKERNTQQDELQSLQQRLYKVQQQIKEQANDMSQLHITAKQTEKELDEKTRAFCALQGDMRLLNDKYVDNIDRVAKIQYSKDMVENELEDLSQRLFEEANGMVANEKREIYHLKVTRQHLENQLKESRDRLAAEEMQLQELRLKMEDMENNSNNKSNRNSGMNYISNSSSSSNRNSNGSMGTLGGLTELEGSDVRGIKDLAGLFPGHALQYQDTNKDSLLDMDTMLLDEFIDFAKLQTSIPLKKIHNIPFMKHCQMEDVDPCLRFGAQSRLSSRKMNEAILMDTCFIEDTPYGFAEEQAKRPVDMPLKISAGKYMLWELFSTSGQMGVFTGCQACGKTNNGSFLPYRFRISYFDDWACIDRFCRDRLVAVCEFYVFIRNVRQGYYGTRTVIDLYQEAMRLRLQMFYARLGALPWTIRTLGMKGDKIGSATSPKFEIPGPLPLSESSPLPRGGSLIYNSNKRGNSLDGELIQEQQLIKDDDMYAQILTSTSSDNKDISIGDTMGNNDLILDTNMNNK
ncbi:hypothetical protein BC941DRAFT_472212 [Chlamydoabsidia padenii]|nr:hypothetical protein BC941DRAFT_472212 [Chlamydoabsidia padenii]